jgi:hypothetical protein
LILGLAARDVVFAFTNCMFDFSETHRMRVRI